MINAIVCVDNNWGIGKKNGLLFNIKADMIRSGDCNFAHGIALADVFKAYKAAQIKGSPFSNKI